MQVKYPNCCVLLVDDEPDLLSALAEIIEPGFEHIFTAKDGIEALAVATLNPIDIVILDLKMPRMGGIPCLKELKKINPDIVAIFLTGFADEDNIREALRLGALEFLDKPVKENELMIALDRSAELSAVRGERKRILEALLYEYTDLEKNDFDKLAGDEKVKFLKTVREILEMKLLRKKNVKSFFKA